MHANNLGHNVCVQKINDKYYLNDDSHPPHEIDIGLIEKHVVFVAIQSVFEYY